MVKKEPAKPVYPDIWARIRSGFAMERLDSPLVRKHEAWFASNPEYMQRMMGRASRYLYYITEEVEKRRMPLEIALLPAIESAYQPGAKSTAAAVGLWQFIHSTGKNYGLRANWWYDGRRDVEASTQAALDYLEKLRDQFDGDWHLALAAYNAGEGGIERRIKYNRANGLPTNYESLRLPEETENYVPKLVAMANIIGDPEAYGVDLAWIPNEPYFARVDMDTQVDLNVVAALANIPLEDVLNINPGYNRRATDPNGRHSVLIPASKEHAVRKGLSDLADHERLPWRRHTVRRGDTLQRVARINGIPAEALRQANQLDSNYVATGQTLLIPLVRGEGVISSYLGSASKSAAKLRTRYGSAAKLKAWKFGAGRSGRLGLSGKSGKRVTSRGLSPKLKKSLAPKSKISRTKPIRRQTAEKNVSSSRKRG